MTRSHAGLLLFAAAVGLLAGCGYSGPRTVTRRWIDCNHYGIPAYVKDRIDVRPHKAHRVATYRWSHVRGPRGPLDSTQPVAVPVEFATRVPGSAPVEGPVSESKSSPIPPPQPLFPEDEQTAPAGKPSPDVVRRPRVRTSWMFRETH